MSNERLQKILSRAGVASRRASEELIRQGRVEVNHAVVTELGTKADPAADDIRVDGRRVAKVAVDHRYFLMYKPRLVVSTRSDPQRRTTVNDLLARAGIKGYFYPVGRLDFESEGLIIMTNDGDFAERVTHPRYELERAYEARVLGSPDERDISRLSTGIIIEGRRTLPAKITTRSSQPVGGDTQTTLEIVLREGRNRQVRRMCEAIGHPVVFLKRTRLGAITARGLHPGDFREMTASEVEGLTRPVPSKPRPAPERAASGRIIHAKPTAGTPKPERRKSPALTRAKARHKPQGRPPAPAGAAGKAQDKRSFSRKPSGGHATFGRKPPAHGAAGRKPQGAPPRRRRP